MVTIEGGEKHVKMSSSATGAPKEQASRAGRVCMKSEKYGDEVITSLRGLRANDELCDFTVCAEGRSIKVHKILLASTSEYFRCMLLGTMRESTQDSVDLKGISACALQRVIDFIYSGEMELEFENLVESLNAASHLQIETAQNLCMDYMISKLDFSNADDLINIAEMFNLERVTKHYRNNKVLKNFEEFSQTPQFEKLSAPQLASYLGDNGLRVRSEFLLYNMVARWYSKDQKRQSQLDSVVKYIRFSLMTEQQLEQLKQHWLTQQFIGGMHYIQSGINYHKEAKAGHPWLTDACQVRSSQEYMVYIHQGSMYHPFEVTAFNHTEGKCYQLATDNSGSRDCRVVSVDNYAYISRVVDCGGGSLMNSLLRFDPRHRDFHELNPCRHLRIDPAFVAQGRALFIIGGTTENGVILDSVECYNIRSNAWVEMQPFPTPCHSHAAVTSGEFIYVSGGSITTDKTPCNTMRCFKSSSQVWEEKAPMLYSRRHHEMTSYKDAVYVLGGVGSHSQSASSQIPMETYDVTTNQWTSLTLSLAGRSVGHFIVFQDQIVSIGREHYEATEDEIRYYDNDADVWRQKMKVPRRNGLSNASATLLSLNFYDEKIYRRASSENRR